MSSKVRRSLSNLELNAYLKWYLHLDFYSSILRVILYNRSKQCIQSEIFEFLGEVPRENINQLTIHIDGDMKNESFLKNERSFINKIKKSVYIACLLEIESCSQNHRSISNPLINLIIKLYPAPFLFAKYSRSRNKALDLLTFVHENEMSAQSNTNVSVHTFSNVKLSGSGLILTGDKITSMDPSVYESKFVSGLWDKLEFIEGSNECYLLNNLSNRDSFSTIEEAIDLTGRSSSNYWHFLVEYLPRLIGRFPSNDIERMPVLINSETPLACQEALSIMFPKTRIIFVQPDRWVSVMKLHSPTFLTKALDSGSIYPEEKLTWDETKFESSINQIKNIDIPEKPHFLKPDKVYIPRRSTYRNVLGQDILENFLQSQGFTTVNPNEITFADQVSIFRDAGIVIAFGGAVWANLIFSNTSTKFVSIVSEAGAPNDVHLQVSNLFGLDFNRITCPTSKRKLEDFYSGIYFRDFTHSNMEINEDTIDEVRKLLQI